MNTKTNTTAAAEDGNLTPEQEAQLREYHEECLKQQQEAQELEMQEHYERLEYNDRVVRWYEHLAEQDRIRARRELELMEEEFYGRRED